MTFWTCVVGSADCTRKCGDGGNGAEASSGINTVICDNEGLVVDSRVCAPPWMVDVGCQERRGRVVGRSSVGQSARSLLRRLG